MTKLYINDGYKFIDCPEMFLSLVREYMGDDSEEYCRSLIPTENFKEQLYECQDELEKLQDNYDEICNQLYDLQNELDEANERIDDLQNYIDDINANEY